MARTIILKCSGDEVLEVDELVAMESQTIKEMIEGGSAENGIAFTEFTANILSKAMEYCKKHVDAAAANEDLSSWDAEFVNVDQATIFDLILAAKKLKIQGLLDLTCQTVADMIKGKTPEEIRRIFNLKNEFTPEEEEEIRRESQWAFE